MSRTRSVRALIFALVFELLRSGPASAEPSWIERIDLGLGRVATPGALARAHAHLEGVSGCTSCHGGLQGTPDRKCIGCHEDVKTRMEDGIGAHGGFRGECRSCHAEHRGVEGDLLGLDRSAFNHDRAIFVLRGAHAGLDCEVCHRRVDPETGRETFQTIGLEHRTCDACHADPHASGMRKERPCGECHREGGWSDLILAGGDQDEGFSHDRDTRFALTGQHIALECRQCHTSQHAEREKREGRPPGTGAPSACVSCHDDVHRGSLQADCGRCHSPVAWKGDGSPFDHDRSTDFPLDPTHGVLACGACHEDVRFQAPGTGCEDCHLDANSLLAGRFDDVRGAAEIHRARLVCADCHDGSIAAPRLLDHERRCAACHTPEYGQLLITRRRILDELVLRGEAAVRADRLAVRRGERQEDANLSRIAHRIERLARSGIHNPDLAETVLRADLDRLGSHWHEEGAGAPSSSR